MNFEKQFIDIYQNNITRPGAEKLLDYLLSDRSDFFTAPYTANHIGSYEGGLCKHSVNTYLCLKDYLDRPRVNDIYNLYFDDETIAITALLHDICKVNYYVADYNEINLYTINDTLPYGHGEKSVYIISGFMRLSREEAFAIRYHKGFSGNEDKESVKKAFEMFPLALALNIADMEASYFNDSCE